MYFPAGTYKISSSIIDYYLTQIIGNPNNLPIIKASPRFTNFSLIDGNQYQPGNAANPAGTLGFGATNVFYRQVKNLILDTTSVPANQSLNCLHWPTSQATSLQNIVFRMSTKQGTQHQGLFIEEGSGGFMNDLIFEGGFIGATFGNQQFTSRNLTFRNCVQAINQIWDWGKSCLDPQIPDELLTVAIQAGRINPSRSTNAESASIFRPEVRLHKP